MESNKEMFKLTEIATWLENENPYVKLPNVQRGFVWRPNQIEDLWDSILRKYPIGSFVFNKDINSQLQLLDGQQRVTAIMLGFQTKTFRGSEGHYKIFIDLELPTNDSRKYVFRVITDSHPWGYQRTPNYRPLEAQKKRDAINLWEGFDIIKPNLSNCFPIEATLPLPLNIFLDAAVNNKSETELLENIFNWNLWNKIFIAKRIESNNSGKLGGREAQIHKLTNDQRYLEKRILDIYQAVIKIISEFKIPALYLENALEDTTIPNLYSEDEINEEQELEVENLFIRLNASGTPLRGEELNYSILKSKIKLETQELIELSCVNFLNPARFITVMFRLYQFTIDKHKSRTTLGMNIKPRQFQARLKSKEDATRFEYYIIDILSKKIFDGKNLIEYTKDILEYHPTNNNYGLPHLLSKKIVNNSAELLFILWYRLIIMKDRITPFESLENKCHRKMLGILTLFLWLGKGDGNRDLSKLLINIWPAMKSLDKKEFWSSAIIKRAMINGILLPVPPIEKGTPKNPSINWFKSQKPTLKSDLFSKFRKISQAHFNSEILFYTNDLILYAQRDFLYHMFNNKLFYLDDTNIPFDWDHIYPHNLVSGKKNIPRIIADFYNSIGNFRAWPYELNRMDSDNLPIKKFAPLKYSENTEDLTKSWQCFIEKRPNLIADVNELTIKLLNWSICSNDWANKEVADVKRDGIIIYNLIIKRAIEIIKIWNRELEIDELTPDIMKGKSTIIQNCFKANKVDENPKWLDKENWYFNDFINLFIKQHVVVENIELAIYIAFPKDSEDLFEENRIYFGVHEIQSNGFIRKLKESEDSPFKIDKSYNCLEGEFTLVSDHKESLHLLLDEIQKWIEHKQFPLKSIRNELLEILKVSLKNDYQFDLKFKP